MNTGRKKASQGVTYLVLSLWALTTIYPFIWVILNSFRQKGLIMSDSFSLPLGEAFTWDNYLTAWHRADFKNAYLNSFLISGTVTICVVLIAGLAAYGLVRYRFRGRSLLYSLIMAGMMFPVFSTIIPVFRMEAVLGLAGTGNRWLSLVAVILPQVAGNLCFAIVILMGFIQSVPIELEESAYLDGCNVFRSISISLFLQPNPLLQRWQSLRFSGATTISLPSPSSCATRRSVPSPAFSTKSVPRQA